jgi:D-apionolactonase
MSLFAAAWTAGSLQSMAAGGAGSVTYFELTGWRGLLESEAGSPLPEKFLSAPGMVYPLYWVFRFLAEMKNASLLAVEATRPLACAGLALKRGNLVRVLITNYLPQEQEIQIGGLPDGEARCCRLNEDTFHRAAFEPAAFLESWQGLAMSQGTALLSLKAYETTMVEIKLPSPE